MSFVVSQLHIQNEQLNEKSIGKKVRFIPIGINNSLKDTWLEGTIVTYNEYYVFVNVSGELKTFFANNLKWGWIKYENI